ncbi:MAG: hypothetical protein JSR46_09515 [Verrucomicrobia bacterium]|nr:hypothetical protein [Verrucomicrobiota bacterium]
MQFQENLLGGAGSRWGNLYIQGQINTAGQTIGGRLANAKTAALQRGRDLSSGVRKEVGSLQALFPTSITNRLRSTGTVIRNHVVKEFSDAFKATKSHFTTVKERLPEGQKELHVPTSLRGSPSASSIENSKRAFNACVEEGFFNELTSFKEINKPKGWASQARDMYEQCQAERPSTVENSQDEHFQSKLAKLQEHLSKLSPEDRAKFLSLSPEEVLAIQMYTAEKDYRLINGMLNGEKRNLETWVNEQGGNIKDLDIEKLHKAFNNINDLIYAAVDKLPQCKEKVVYRSGRSDKKDLTYKK